MSIQSIDKDEYPTIMADHIPPDEIRRRLILFLRIPNEVWTDVLMALPRRNLVKNISLACYRLKEISNKNVKSIHVITKAEHFTDKLEADSLVANLQLAHLAGHKCGLAAQFRLTKIQLVEKNKAILRHCLDLFEGCQIRLDFNPIVNLGFYLECLTLMESAKPLVIHAAELVNQFNHFWRNPTIWQCNRLALKIYSQDSLPSEASGRTQQVQNELNAEAIYKWLHHVPDEQVDADSAVDAAFGGGQAVRCMILYLYGDINRAISRLLDRCIQNFRESKNSADRRSFVLSFPYRPRNGVKKRFGRIENHSTRELLVLERNIDTSPGQCRFRRCLAEEAEEYGAEFYGKLFKPGTGDGFDEFQIVKSAQVLIG